MDHFPYIKTQFGSETKQKKLNYYVYSFLLFVSFGRHYQAEFQYFKSGFLIADTRNSNQNPA